LHPDDREWAVDFCIRATLEGRDHGFEYRMIAADNRVVWVRDLVTVIAENSHPAKLRGIILDITERKRVEDALRRSETELNLALDAARLGNWSWDIVTGETHWS